MLKQYSSTPEHDLRTSPKTRRALEIQYISQQTAKYLDGYTVLAGKEKTQTHACFLHSKTMTQVKDTIKKS